MNLLIRFDSLKIRSFSTFGVSDVCFFNTCVMFLNDVYMVWSVSVYSSYYVSDGFNLWCIPGAILWHSWLLFNTSCYNRRTSCSQELNHICECFSDAQWLRTGWTKGFNKLVVSCLKTEAEPASETQHFSVYRSVTRCTKSKGRRLYLNVIHHRQNITVLR